MDPYRWNGLLEKKQIYACELADSLIYWIQRNFWRDDHFHSSQPILVPYVIHESVVP